MNLRSAKTACSSADLHPYLDGSLSDDQAGAFEAHLAECSVCRARLEKAVAAPSLWMNVGRFLPTDEWDTSKGRGLGRQLLESSVAKTRVNPDAAQPPRIDVSGKEDWATHALREIKGWLDPTDDPDKLGRFGGYEVVGLVGQGGMGTVLKAFETPLNRYVAVKMLSPHLASNAAARLRFAREARAAAAVLHENVLAIHRVAEAHGLPYLVMPYVAGESLQKRIDANGPLSLTALLRIGRQIAAGLAAAHGQGLVHRDIKPANILLERGVDRATITDFGLARAVDDGSITRTGVIAGTPQYMSPEQAQGQPLDARSDLFSLGSVMYAMATGRAPFQGETGLGILRLVCETTPPSMRIWNPHLPVWFEAIVNKLHAKQADDRFGDAAEVARLLEQCLAHVQQPAIPLPIEVLDLARKSRRPRCWPTRGKIVVATLSALVLGSVLWIGWPRQAPNVGDPENPAKLANDEDATNPTASAESSLKVETLDIPQSELDSLESEVLRLENDVQENWEQESPRPPRQPSPTPKLK